MKLVPADHKPGRDGQHTETRGGHVRPSEFHRTVEERVVDDPIVEYNTDEDQAHADYPEHGELATAAAAPVYLVQPPPRSRDWTEWTSATMGVGSQPTQIGDASRNRIRFVVRNLDAVNNVFLTRLRTDSVMAAFTLGPGQTIEMFHNGPIAVSAAAEGTQVTYFNEYDIDDPPE